MTRSTTKRRGVLRAQNRLIGALLGMVVVGLAAGHNDATALGDTPPPITQDLAGQPVMVLLDLSGSMNEDDGAGTVKLDGAKQAISEVAREFSPAITLGLWTYPGSGDYIVDGCSVGDSNYPLGSLEPSRLSAEVDALTASGDTPTGPALRAAIDHMKAAGKASGLVVLVSDGLSNCGPPPCDVAKQVRSEGFDVTAAVVGFQISEDGRNELECIAAETGGAYVDAQDSEELTTAISNFVGPQLTMSVEGHNATLLSGTRQVVRATVTNKSPSVTARGLAATLAFTDATNSTAVRNASAGNTTVFPAVLPPRARLGNLPPGQSLTYEWHVAVPSVKLRSVAAPQVTLQSTTGSPVIVKGGWSISPDTLNLTNAGPLLKEGRRLVILGDSYSSGEGTFSYLPGTPTVSAECHRSLQTYGLALFSRDGKVGPDDGSAILACSGAVTENYFDSQPGGFFRTRAPSQREQLHEKLWRSGSPPDLALMTFGGNDVGFADIITVCALPKDCTQDRLWTARRFVDLANLDQQLTKLYVAVSADLNSYQARESRDGEWAPLVVLGYPQVLANSGSCSNLNSNERDFGIRVGQEINREIREAVETVQGQGLPVYFADSVEASMLPNNTMCAPEGRRWVNPIALKDVFSTRVEQMHPNASGYAAMTAALVQWSQAAKKLPEPYKLPPDSLPLDSGWLARIGSTLNQLTVPRYAVDLEFQSEPSDVFHRAAPEQRLTVRMSGLAPNSNVRLTMYSAPRTLANLPVDDEGRVEAHVRVPRDSAPGKHTLLAEGVDRKGEVITGWSAIDVKPPLPWWGWVVVATTLVTAVAALYLVHRWRRNMRRDQQASRLPA